MTIFWALLTAFAFGVADTTTRLGIRTATPFTGAIVNSVAMSLTLGAVVWARGLGPGALWPAVGWYGLAGAAALAPGRLLYYVSVQRIGVSRASVLISTTPFAGILLAVAFLGERPTWHIPVGTAFIVAGVVGLLTGRSAIRIPLAGALFGFTPALFFALVHVFMRLGMQSLPDPLLGTTVSAVTAMVALLAGQGLIPRQSRWGADRRGVWVLALAGVCLGIAFLLLYKTLSLGPVSFVTPLTYTAPLFTISISRIFLQELEHVTWRLALGALVVSLGAALVSLSRGG